MRRDKLPPYVTSYQDRGGIQRYRFRRLKNGRYVQGHLPGKPFSADWFKSYQEYLDASERPAKIGAARLVPGSIGELVALYRASSAWLDKRASTRAAWQGSLNRLCDMVGRQPVEQLRIRHANAMHEKLRAAPYAADNFVKRMRALWGWGARMEYATANPWQAVKLFNRPTTGHHAWTMEEVAQFRQTFPLGTKARLAMELFLATFSRISDARTLGPANIRNGHLEFVAQKNSEPVAIPITSELRAAFDATPQGHMVFLVTEKGAPYSKKGIGNWFAKKCKKAGVPGRAHGLRKAAAIRMALAGATVIHLMAWGGWRSPREPLLYIRQAERLKLAEAGLEKLSSKLPS